MLRSIGKQSGESVESVLSVLLWNCYVSEIANVRIVVQSIFNEHGVAACQSRLPLDRQTHGRRRRRGSTWLFVLDENRQPSAETVLSSRQDKKIQLPG